MDNPGKGPLRAIISAAALTGLLSSCAGEPEPVQLGPRDGQDLPPTELERVRVGNAAPDFSLETLSGDTLTLSGFRGERDVVLVFYRGHW